MLRHSDTCPTFKGICLCLDFLKPVLLIRASVCVDCPMLWPVLNGIFRIVHKTLISLEDIVIITENEQELQTMLGIIYKWTRKWCLLINYGKTHVIH